MNDDQKTNLRVQALAFAMASANTLPPERLLEAAKQYYAFLIDAPEPPAAAEVDPDAVECTVQ